MRLQDILPDDTASCEAVFIFEDTQEVIPACLVEGISRRFKRSGGRIRRMFRCGSGPKKGMIVADPKQCSKRKDPKRVRRGRKIMRQLGALIHRKGKVTRHTSQSKLLHRLNSRLH